MSDFRRTLLAAALILLAGVTLARLFGPPYLGVAVVAVISVYQTYRARRRAYRRALGTLIGRLRAEGPEGRGEILSHIESDELRDYLERAVAAEVEIERDGDLVKFRYSPSALTWARGRYWKSWSVAVLLLGIAAFLPNLSTTWRVIWFTVGIGACLSVAHAAFRQRLLGSMIELTPVRLSQVWPDGTRVTVRLSQPVTITDRPRRHLMTMSNGVRSEEALVGYGLVGYNHLVELLHEYAVNDIATTDAFTAEGQDARAYDE